MKKFLSIILAAVMVFATLALVSCKKEETTGDDATVPANVKFGMGVYTEVSAASDATEDKDGQGKITSTVAAVLIDAEGKIVSCQLDTADNTVAYTFEGKAVANDTFKTKAEFGKDYNMVAYGGAAKEWFEQADAFEGVVKGKTVDEIKALVAEGDKGTDEVVNAGCTIMINEFVLAIEKAVKNAADSKATADSALKLGIYTEQTCKDAEEEKDGQSKLETTVFAAAVDAEGKVIVSSSDCVQVTFTFDVAGASTYDLTKAVSTKKEAGDNYGMKAYGGAAKEWYEQAAAFDAACVGKNATEIEAFLGEDNYGNADIKAAGCTILVNGFVKAAAKIK